MATAIEVAALVKEELDKLKPGEVLSLLADNDRFTVGRLARGLPDDGWENARRAWLGKRQTEPIIELPGEE